MTLSPLYFGAAPSPTDFLTPKNLAPFRGGPLADQPTILWGIMANAVAQPGEAERQPVGSMTPDQRLGILAQLGVQLGGNKVFIPILQSAQDRGNGIQMYRVDSTQDSAPLTVRLEDHSPRKLVPWLPSAADVSTLIQPS